MARDRRPANGFSAVPSRPLDRAQSRILTTAVCRRGKLWAVEQAEVVALYNLLDDHGIEVWLDGGWGIDALIGEQTRPHSDLDIAVRHADVAELRRLLMDRGYEQVERADTEPWIFVLSDERGHQLDVHAF